MYRRAFRAAFPATVPVLMGYLSIGIAFGLMLEAIGYNVIWAFFMSLTILCRVRTVYGGWNSCPPARRWEVWPCLR